MITKEDFLFEFSGHENRYSSYLVLGATVEAVIDVLNQIDPDMCVGSGCAHDDGSVSFEICKESPALIYDITERLHTTGYADTDWDYTCTLAARNGKDFDDWYAEETYGELSPHDEDEDDLWDAFVTITDKATGIEFYTGGGAVGKEVMQYYRDMIDTHRK